MRSLWRRFLAWWNAEDVLAELGAGTFGREAVHTQHCPLCARATEIARAYPKENA